MKKSLLVVLCGTILGAALILGACSNNSTNTTAANDAQSILEEYLNSEVNQEGFDEINEQMESLGISMEVYADGSSIVYNYKYLNIPSSTEGLADSIKEDTDGHTDSFVSTIGQIETELGIDGLTIVNNYIGSDGVIFYSETYSKDGVVK